MTDKPLIRDTTLTRVAAGVVAALLSAALGWSMTTLGKIQTQGTKIIANVDNLKDWVGDMDQAVQAMGVRIDDTNARVDELEHTLLQALIEDKRP